MPAANAKRKNIRPSASKVDRKVMRYIMKLEQEIEQLKTNPDTIVGKLIPQMREAVGQNKRLSVLAATLIEEGGGRVTVSKDKLESFESKVLSIKWELPKDETDPEKATEFIFSYDAVTQEQAAQQQGQVTITSNDETPTVDIAEPESVAGSDPVEGETPVSTAVEP
jgi:hypothetical protein